MKIEIVKNDKFETVGLHAYSQSSNDKLFSWGCSPCFLYFVKEMETDKWDAEIFRLVRLEGKVDYYKNFKSDFLTFASMQGLLPEGKGVNLKHFDVLLKQTKDQMMEIINKII